MSKTAVIYTPRYLDHNPGSSHPESPKRLRTIMKELSHSGLLQTRKCSVVDPNPASVKDVELVHASDYIQLVERFCALGGGTLDLGSTVASPESYSVALLAAGGAMKAVDLVMTAKFKNAFALVRPPGHHAGPSYAMGFCIFNNVAIAATHLLRHFNLDRIAVLDIDAHHGNATQEIFYTSDKVLYMSLHEDPTEFPGAGFIDEVGDGEGVGYTVNVPFPYLVDDYVYLKAIDHIVIPIVKQYKPQFILVSAGFDGHYTDPVAELALSTFSYVEVFRKILKLASRLCAGKLVGVLEGGYSLNFLGKTATAVIAEMAGVPYSFQDKHQTANPEIQKQAEKTIEDVIHIQSSFWNL